MNCYHLLQMKRVKIAKHSDLDESLHSLLVSWVLSLDNLQDPHLIGCEARTR